MPETQGKRFRRYVREIDVDMVRAWWYRPSKWRLVISAPFVVFSLLLSLGLLAFSWLTME